MKRVQCAALTAKGKAESLIIALVGATLYPLTVDVSGVSGCPLRHPRITMISSNRMPAS